MPNTTISPERQKEILSTIRALASGGGKGPKTIERERHLLLIGVYVALGATCPPHWVINIQCGRTDRLFEEEALRKNYDVLGLKGDME
jgi:hypothetical protein